MTPSIARIKKRKPWFGPVAWRFLALALAIAGIARTEPLALADEDMSKYAVWITGDVFMQNGFLLFRADKPVRGNRTGNILLLGATKQTIKFLAPCYMKAADKHLKLRLYGILVPEQPGSPARAPDVPSVEFITWKLHPPSDPDELPAKDKIIIPPGETVPGYSVRLGGT
jgi:hypothetical protein